PQRLSLPALSPYATLFRSLVGWRIHGSLADAALAYVIMVSFAFAMVWIGVLIGSLVPTPEGATGVAFVVLFPFSFIASTFVPVTDRKSTRLNSSHVKISYA